MTAGPSARGDCDSSCSSASKARPTRAALAAQGIDQRLGHCGLRRWRAALADDGQHAQERGVELVAQAQALDQVHAPGGIGRVRAAIHQQLRGGRVPGRPAP